MKESEGLAAGSALELHTLSIFLSFTTTPLISHSPPSSVCVYGGAVKRGRFQSGPLDARMLGDE